jgi:tetratricopeptide (TPR) repeat protein
MVKTKHTLTSFKSPASRQFTDREQFVDTFYRLVEEKQKDQYQLCVFYGVGGVGKSSLRKKLGQILDIEFDHAVWTVLDFEIANYRSPETALYLLRKQLNKNYAIDFPLFDIAYSIYWKKVHPDKVMNKQTFPLLEESHIIGDLIAAVGEVPLIGMVPKLFKSVLKGKESIVHYLHRIKHELFNLENYEPSDIIERLPMYFANDFKNYLTKKDSVLPILFFDTYEALWESNRTEANYLTQDDWVRELVGHLPEVLWFICGREKLRWAEKDQDWAPHLEQHLIGKLSDFDSESFLISCGILDNGVQNTIIETSEGLPYYLDLAVDTYENIRKKHIRNPVKEDFAETTKDVFSRFMKYLDQHEIETLKVLSVPRFFNFQLYKSLVQNFQTGYPITSFDDLCNFSFMNETESPDLWYIHQLMRKSLHECQSSVLLREVHTFVHKYYSEKIKEEVIIKQFDQEEKMVLTEAVYHAKKVLSEDSLVSWLEKVTEPYIKTSKYTFIAPIYEDMISFIETESSDASTIYKLVLTLAKVKCAGRKYKDAKPIIEKALSLTKLCLGDDHPTVAEINVLFAEYFYRYENDMKKAEDYYKQALDIQERTIGDDLETAVTYNSFAIFYTFIGQYDLSEQFYKKAYAIRKERLGEPHYLTSASINNIGCVMLRKKRPEEGLFYLERALQMIKETVGENTRRYVNTYHSIGNAHFMLGNLKKAEEIFNQLVGMKVKVYPPSHIEVARLSRDFGKLYRDTNRWKEAIPHFKEAIIVMENEFGPENMHHADIYHEFGKLYSLMGEIKLAKSLYSKAIAIREQVLGATHDSIKPIQVDLKKLSI